MASYSSWELLGQLRMSRSREAKETASPSVLFSDRISSGCMEKPARPNQRMSWKTLVDVPGADAAQRKGSGEPANYHTAPRRPKVLQPVRALTSAPVLGLESLLGLGLLVEVGSGDGSNIVLPNYPNDCLGNCRLRRC